MPEITPQTDAETGFTIYGQASGIKAETYSAPRLFDRFADFADEHERWRYLRDELAAMARDKTLCLTDVLNQEPNVADCCGDVLYNRVLLGRKEHRQHHYSNPLPPELLARCIRVRSLNGAPIKWCRDMVPTRTISRGRVKTDSGERRVEDEIVNTNQTDVMLTPQEAWLCLKESGKFVARATRQAHQEKVWKCEEVRPEVKPVSDDAKPKRGRPSFAEANKQ